MTAPEHAHHWGLWISYDPMIIEWGMTDGFCYHRTCQIFGCDAKLEETEGHKDDHS